jgi:succinate dehydrogenase / fumarate reductase flavoprotein subunit
MLDLVLVDGKAKGIVTRDLVTGAVESWSSDVVVVCTGGYGNVFYLSTNAQGCNVTATFRAHRRGAGFANPCYTQIHPTCIPVHGEDQSKLTLMSESLRNDGRVWVPKNAADCAKPASEVPEEARDYFLERKYPSYGNLAPRDIASRAAKEVCDEGRGVGQLVDGKRLGVYLDFSAAIKRLGEAEVRARYGNLFDMYENITGENAYRQPMRIFPAVHYTMGGLWVDYNLQSNIPGLFVGGEANFSDHGANRLGASALMQGLADGYFVLPYTVTDFLAGEKPGSRPSVEAPEFKAVVKDVNDRVAKLLSINGTKSPRHYHKALGKITWEKCGMARDKAGLEGAIRDLQALRDDFWKNVKVVGSGDALAPELERAGRVADFLDFGIMMCLDALTREESCGGHFRTEYQDAGEAKRNDDQYAHAAVWEWRGDGQLPARHAEPLVYEETQLSTRSYK